MKLSTCVRKKIYYVKKSEWPDEIWYKISRLKNGHVNPRAKLFDYLNSSIIPESAMIVGYNDNDWIESRGGKKWEEENELIKKQLIKKISGQLKIG